MTRDDIIKMARELDMIDFRDHELTQAGSSVSTDISHPEKQSVPSADSQPKRECEPVLNRHP